VIKGNVNVSAAGSATFTNDGSITTKSGGRVTVTGGTGGNAVVNNGDIAYGLTFTGGPNTDVFVNTRSNASNFTFSGGGGDDIANVSGKNLSSFLLDGGTGNDTYVFPGDVQGTVTVRDAAVAGTDASSDTMDFSSFTGGPINLDLAKNGSTPQKVTPLLNLL